MISNNRKKIVSLISSEYWRNVLVVSGGTLGSQALQLLFVPIITRVYDAETFGGYAEYIAISSILGVLAFFGLERAIPLVDKSSLKAFIKRLTVIAFIMISFLTIGYSIYNNLFGDRGIDSIVAIVLLTTSSALTNLVSFVVIGIKKFKIEALAKLSQSLIIPVGQILTSNISKTSILLTLVDGVVRFLISSFVIIRIWMGLPKSSVNEVDFGQYKAFYSWGLLASLFIILSSNLPIILTALYYGSYEAGILFMTMKLASVPLALIGSSIGKVYFSEIASYVHMPIKVLEIYKDNLKKLFFIFMFIVLPILMVIQISIPYVLGKDWILVRKCVFLLLPMLWAQFVVSPLSMATTIFKMQHLDLIFAVLRAILVILPFLVFARRYSFETTIILMSFFSMFSYILFAYSNWKVIVNASR